jgi:hypothetical protein
MSIDHLFNLIPLSWYDEQFEKEIEEQNEFLRKGVEFCMRNKNWRPNYPAFYSRRLHSIIDLFDRKGILLKAIRKELI